MIERDESENGQISPETLPTQTETRLKPTVGATEAPALDPSSTAEAAPVSGEQSVGAHSEPVSDAQRVSAHSEPVSDEQSISAHSEPVSDEQRVSAQSEPVSDEQRVSAPSAAASAEQSAAAPSSAEPPVSRRLLLIPEGEDGAALPLSDTPSRPGVAEADELVGQLVDARYRIESVLGIGSMGIVYVARHLAVGKRVALKVLRQQFVEDAEVTQRFASEATAATAIGNAHIVDTLDFGKLQNGSAYQVMEFLEGQMLSEALRRGRSMPLERILSIARQVAVGLEAAHEAGIVHRDLKPDNVFLVEREQDRDFVKILDFGIAKFGVGQNDLTHAGAIFGTPNYMAPEQALGKATSPATDIYALGVILYEMASGDVPFRGESPIAVLTRHATELPEPLAKRVKGLPLRFQNLVQRCLEKEPADRFPSMRALIDELDAVAAGVPVPPTLLTPAAPSVEPVERVAPRPSNGHAGWIALLVLAGLAGAAYGGFKLHENAPPPTAAASALPEPAPVALAADEAPPSAGPEKTRDVALVLFPLDAHVVVGDRDLGAMPVTVKVPEGQTVNAEVRRDGYWTRKLRLDGSKTRIVVGLVKRDGNAPPTAGAASAAAPPSDDH
jgi:serine/threonine-protein kinase